MSKNETKENEMTAMTAAEQTALHQTARLFVTANKPVTTSRRRIARDAFSRAFAAVVRAEDEIGIDASAWVTDNLTAARQEAMAAGHLTPQDVIAAERAGL